MYTCISIYIFNWGNRSILLLLRAVSYQPSKHCTHSPSLFLFLPLTHTLTTLLFSLLSMIFLFFFSRLSWRKHILMTRGLKRGTSERKNKEWRDFCNFHSLRQEERIVSSLDHFFFLLMPLQFFIDIFFFCFHLLLLFDSFFFFSFFIYFFIQCQTLSVCLDIFIIMLKNF